MHTRTRPPYWIVWHCCCASSATQGREGCTQRIYTAPSPPFLRIAHTHQRQNERYLRTLDRDTIKTKPSPSHYQTKTFVRRTRQKIGRQDLPISMECFMYDLLYKTRTLARLQKRWPPPFREKNCAQHCSAFLSAEPWTGSTELRIYRKRVTLRAIDVSG